MIFLVMQNEGAADLVGCVLLGIREGYALAAANRVRCVCVLLDSFEKDTLMANVTGVTPDDGAWKKELAKADLVVEAVFENLELKHKVGRACTCCKLAGIFYLHCAIFMRLWAG